MEARRREAEAKEEEKRAEKEREEAERQALAKAWLEEEKRAEKEAADLIAAKKVGKLLINNRQVHCVFPTFPSRCASLSLSSVW